MNAANPMYGSDFSMHALNSQQCKRAGSEAVAWPRPPAHALLACCSAYPAAERVYTARACLRLSHLFQARTAS